MPSKTRAAEEKLSKEGTALESRPKICSQLTVAPHPKISIWHYNARQEYRFGTAMLALYPHPSCLSSGFLFVPSDFTIDVPVSS